jgi:predicted permease
MFSFKNWVAIGLFLFGTTFLWMTRDFLANPREGTGVLWSVIQALVFAAILGFAVAAWGVFKEGAWWEPVAAASAIAGMAALVPCVIGVRQVGDSGDAGVQLNIVIHAVGIVAVFALVFVPVVHDWIARRI